MLTDHKVRIDKWLWAVRIFKTRSKATEACRNGKVLIRNQQVKPSRLLKINDIVQVKKPPVVYSYQVLGLPGNRLSAKAIHEYVGNITPEEELKKLKIRDSFFIVRDKGAGRPTKKERRVIDKLRGD